MSLTCVIVRRAMRRAAWVIPLFALHSACALAQTSPPAKTIPIELDAQAAGQPFPHFWGRMFGSGNAVLALRADYRRDL